MSYGSIGSSSGGGGGGYSRNDDSTQLERMLDRCSQNAQQLDANIKELDRLHAQLLTSSSSSLIEIIHRKEQATNRLVSATADLMHKLSELHTNDAMLNTKRQRLLNQCKSGCARYRSLQQKIVTSVRSITAAQQQLEQQQQQQQQSDESPFLQQDQLQSRAELDHMQQQEQQMEGLLNDIVDIEQMFQDMSAMVYEQGQGLDDIAANVSTVVDNTEAGEVELKAAVVYRSKARKKKVCLAFIIIIALVILGLIIYFSVKN